METPKLNDAVVVKFGYGYKFRAQGVGRIIKLSDTTAQVELTEPVINPNFREGLPFPAVWEAGYVLKGLAHRGSKNWNEWNSYAPLEVATTAPRPRPDPRRGMKEARPDRWEVQGIATRHDWPAHRDALALWITERLEGDVRFAQLPHKCAVLAKRVEDFLQKRGLKVSVFAADPIVRVREEGYSDEPCNVVLQNPNG